MNQISPQSQYNEGTEPFQHLTTHHPRTTKAPTQPARKWTTEWHGLEDAEGILARRGRVRVQLWPDQWVIAVRKSNRDKWDPVSYHRECRGVLQVLREKQNVKGAEPLAEDYEQVRQALMAL
ncbi:hypothetical protein EDD52_102462 [Primorskyibacter sedentarius]|uniref:Uncharacterized protein n=1 Tax=Primorskyibacter sedentarius TaxID=745311 RepID=A0A4R3JK38_9RHOB|nr:hypothetical protein EDD52_102462 [Primorskyibacter sedentarius]